MGKFFSNYGFQQVAQATVHQPGKSMERYAAQMTNKIMLRKKKWKIFVVEIFIKNTKQLVVREAGVKDYRLKRLRLFLILFSVLYFHLFCYSTGKIHVDVYVTVRGRMQLKSLAGG